MAKAPSSRLRTRAAVWSTAALLVASSSVAAASTASAEQLPVAKSAAPFDFNGDGYADLAAGMPYRSVGGAEYGGAVEIVYGSARGLTASRSQLLTQDSPGIKGRAREWAFVGQSVTSADFDGDGYADLVTRAANDALVVYGGPRGLTTRDQLTHVERYGLGLGSLSSFPVATGDFNGDGRADLVVSDSLNEDESGRLVVIPGSPSGLLTRNGLRIDRDTAGVPGPNLIESPFGAAIAVGDITGDGYDDLAVTADDGREDEEGPAPPGDAKTGPVVHVFLGSASGVRTIGSTVVSTADLAGPGLSFSPVGDGSLAVADFDSDGFGDLVVGDPGGGYPSTPRTDPGGVVVVARGSAGGPDLRDRQIWHQDSVGVPGGAERGDRFGATLAVGDLDGDSHLDLAVGVPSEGRGRMGSVGAVNVLYGTPDGLSSVGAEIWSQASRSIKGVPRRDDNFSSGLLRILDFGGPAQADLAIHSPNDRPGGSVSILPGSPAGVTAADQLWRSNSPGLDGRTRRATGGFGGECC